MHSMRIIAMAACLSLLFAHSQANAGVIYFPTDQQSYLAPWINNPPLSIGNFASSTDCENADGVQVDVRNPGRFSGYICDALIRFSLVSLQGQHITSALFEIPTQALTSGNPLPLDVRLTEVGSPFSQPSDVTPGVGTLVGSPFITGAPVVIDITPLISGLVDSGANYVQFQIEVPLSSIPGSIRGAFFPYSDNIRLDITAVPIPEPLTASLFGTGLVAAIAMRRCRKKGSATR